MSDFVEMEEEMRLATPQGTRMRRGDTQEDIGNQGLADYAYCVEQLGEKLDMDGTLFEIMEENGIDDDSKLSEAVEELIGILAYKVFFEEILLMDLTGSASQVLEMITDKRLSLMELAILTPEEWESDYGIKLNKKMVRRMAAFHHWLANPDPKYPTSNYRRLADMDRNKFENYMMTVAQA
eukprot:scaffold746_cov137-Amphora_coffeaeformis.AAC.1